MFRLAFLLLAICTAAPSFQQGTDREQDVYAIYSLMLTNPQTSHGPDDNKFYLIAGTTAPGVPKRPCIAPPKEREADRGADFREALADFNQRGATQRQLSRAFSIQKPYVLLNAEEVREFQELHTIPKPAGAPAGRFQGATDLFTLSDVYFNQSGTLALTAISSWCGITCGLYSWMVFERPVGGTWKDTQWPACLTIAERWPDWQLIPAALRQR